MWWMGSLLLVSKKYCAPCSLDSGLSHPGRIRIDAHRSKACRCGWPRSFIWSVCTRRSRLPTVVASERFVSVWATGRNSRLQQDPFPCARWKYHLLLGHFSGEGECQGWFGLVFFSVPVVTTSLVTDIYPPPPLLRVCVISFSTWSRFCPSHSGFTLQFWFLEGCAKSWWVGNFSTNLLCGPFHINCQGISRFAQFASVFLTFKYFVPPNRKHKFPSLSTVNFSLSLSISLFLAPLAEVNL